MRTTIAPDQNAAVFIGVTAFFRLLVEKRDHGIVDEDVRTLSRVWPWIVGSLG
jgi:hypothetical protein